MSNRNSGYFLIILAVYFASLLNKKVIIYGYDLGEGGLNYSYSKQAADKRYLNDAFKIEFKDKLQQLRSLVNIEIVSESYFKF